MADGTSGRIPPRNDGCLIDILHLVLRHPQTITLETKDRLSRKEHTKVCDADAMLDEPNQYIIIFYIPAEISYVKQATHSDWTSP